MRLAYPDRISERKDLVAGDGTSSGECPPWVISVVLSNRRLPIDFRFAPKATEILAAAQYVAMGQEPPLTSCTLCACYSSPMKEANSSTGMRGMLMVYSTELVSA